MYILKVELIKINREKNFLIFRVYLGFEICRIIRFCYVGNDIILNIL